MFHYRAQTFAKIALAIEAPFSGTVFLVTYGTQSPMGNSNDYSKQNFKARHSWKAAFYFFLNTFHSISIMYFFKADESCTVDKYRLSIHLSILSVFAPGGRGSGTPLYELYRYARPQMVGLFSRFGHDGIGFGHFGLK